LKTRKFLHLYAAIFLYATKLQLNMLYLSKIFRFVSKWELCSKWPQKNGFLTITQSRLKNFMFTLLILVNGYIYRIYTAFLFDSRWRLATNFQSAVTFVLMKFFSQSNPLGKWCHLEPKWKNFFHNFSPKEFFNFWFFETILIFWRLSSRNF
jgi:hypothetical protein